MEGEQEWYPKFGKAFHDEFTSEYIDQLETFSDPDFLVNLLRKYSPSNKLEVVCIAAPHDLALVPVELYPNMNLWCMGGGFEDLEAIDPETGVIPVEDAGYNWGITPSITNQVLTNLIISGTMMTLISSKIVRRLDVSVPLDSYTEWDKHSLHESVDENTTCVQTRPDIRRAIMIEWQNSNRGNKLKTHKNMCDPLLLHLCAESVPFDSINVKARCDENQTETGSYLATKNLITMVETNEHPNVKLVTGFDRDTVVSDMLAQLDIMMK